MKKIWTKEVKLITLYTALCNILSSWVAYPFYSMSTAREYLPGGRYVTVRLDWNENFDMFFTTCLIPFFSIGLTAICMSYFFRKEFIATVKYSKVKFATMVAYVGTIVEILISAPFDILGIIPGYELPYLALYIVGIVAYFSGWYIAAYIIYPNFWNKEQD